MQRIIRKTLLTLLTVVTLISVVGVKAALNWSEASECIL